MKRCLAVIALLMLIGASVLSAQDFRHIDMRHGLSESRIRQIKQMADGRMAIATTATIDIYDGTRFTTYKLPPEYAYPIPQYRGGRQLRCDSTGLIWLRNDRKLYVLDSDKGELIKDVEGLMDKLHLSESDIANWPKDKDPQEYAGIEDVWAVEKDCYGGLWVGTKENGLLYSNELRQRQFKTFPDSVFTFTRLKNFCSPRASQLSAQHAPSATNCTMENKANYAFIGTRFGLMIFNEEDRLVATLDEQDGLSTNNIQSIVSDSHDDVWIATANGISRIRTVGRDSFDITNYGEFDGLNVAGREFRTCQIHISRANLVTIGFAGGIATFVTDSVNAPRYTFHYPRKANSATSGQTETRQYGVWLTVLLAALAATGFVFWRIRKRKTTHPDTHTKRIEQPAPSDEMLNELKKTPQETSADEAFIAHLHAIVEQNIGDENFSVQTLSDELAMDRTGLYRRMQSLLGVSPSNYIKNVRMDIAARLLRETSMPTADIAIKTGFATTKYFNKVFKEHFGISPSDYREQ